MKSVENKRWLIPTIIVVSILLVIIGVGGIFVSGSFSLKKDALQFLEVFIGVVGLIVSFLLEKSNNSGSSQIIKEPFKPDTVLKKNKQSVDGAKNITIQDVSSSQINIGKDKQS